MTEIVKGTAARRPVQTRPKPVDPVLAMLGLTATIRSSLELVFVIRKGLPYTSLQRVSTELDLPVVVTGLSLGLVGRTIARRIQKKEPLTPEESERVVRLARVLGKAVEVLGSLAKARRWVRKPSRALGGAAPLTMLDTGIGSNAVLRELGRIDHGVFA